MRHQIGQRVLAMSMHGRGSFEATVEQVGPMKVCGITADYLVRSDAGFEGTSLWAVWAFQLSPLAPPKVEQRALQAVTP